MELEVRTADDLAKLQRQLKAMDKVLAKRISSTITKATKPIKAKIKSNTSRLPQSGGLGARVASSALRTQNRVSGRNIGVRITGKSNNASLKALDAGSNRHKAWGRDGAWYDQAVEPGFFSDAVKDGGEAATALLLHEANQIAREIESAH